MLNQPTRAILVVALTASLFFVGVTNQVRAQATANGLDPSFGGDGIATTNFSPPAPGETLGSLDTASDLAIQPDGKIVVVGNTGRVYPDWDFAVARYHRSGGLDNTFASGGKQIINFRGASAEAVALQPDGKIVVAGSHNTNQDFYYTGDNFALARLNSDGSLDQTFGREGRVVTDFFHNFDRALDVAIQTDGKIVAAGTVSDLQHSYLGLARYNKDGSLDDGSARDTTPSDSFGDHGKLIVNMGAGAILIQPDGKIVLGGSRFASGHNNFALARYHSDGSPDTGFGRGGQQTTDFLTESRIAGLALQPDGKIVAAGNAGDSFALARYNPNGRPDTTFDGDGKQTTAFPGARAEDVAILPDGKIMMAGTRPDPNGVVVLCCVNPRDFALARYNPNGSLDPTFDDDGKLFTDLYCGRFSLYPYVTGSVDIARAIAAQPDGKVVVAGSVYRGDRFSTDFAVARYTVNATSSVPPLGSVGITNYVSAVLGGTTVTGWVQLCNPHQSDTAVTLSDNLASANVPTSVTIPAGHTTATFKIKTTPVTDIETGALTATLGGVTKSARLVVRPLRVESLTLSPNPAQGSQTVTGIVTLERAAPAGGVVVRLSSSNPAVAYPTQSELTISLGSSRRSFTIRTNKVSSSRWALIRAGAYGVSQSQVLRVQ